MILTNILFSECEIWIHEEQHESDGNERIALWRNQRGVMELWSGVKGSGLTPVFSMQPQIRFLDFARMIGDEIGEIGDRHPPRVGRWSVLLRR
jgi:hypothetical protein